MRIDQIDEPPIQGRDYRVPCVHGRWCDRTGWWPVLLPLHTDTDHFAFPHRHYHVDLRFITHRRIPKKAKQDPASALRWPLTDMLQPNHTSMPLSEVEWRRRRCQRIKTLEHGEPWLRRIPMISTFRQKMAGRACTIRNGRPLCPHRAADLSTVPAVDGVVTCPLHGLRIDTATWRVRPHEEDNT